jgi:hypothetical protein
MTVSVERLPNEPIVIAYLSGKLSVQDILTMFEETIRLTPDVDGRVYRITNVLDVETTFPEMMQIIRESGKGGRGSTSDPNIKAVFVGTNHWIEFTRQAMSQPQHGRVNLHLFTKLEDALDFVRGMAKLSTTERGIAES